MSPQTIHFSYQVIGVKVVFQQRLEWGVHRWNLAGETSTWTTPPTLCYAGLFQHLLYNFEDNLPQHPEQNGTELCLSITTPS